MKVDKNEFMEEAKYNVYIQFKEPEERHKDSDKHFTKTQWEKTVANLSDIETIVANLEPGEIMCIEEYMTDEERMRIYGFI